MYLVDEEGTLENVMLMLDLNGRPEAIESIYIMKEPCLG
jgi:hypothetical protein